MGNPDPEQPFKRGETYHLTSANTHLADALAIGFGDRDLGALVEPSSRPMLALWVRAGSIEIVEDEPGNPDSAIMTVRPVDFNFAMPWWLLADLGGMIKAAYVRMPIDVRDQWDRRRAATFKAYDAALGKLVYRDGGWVPE